MADKLIFTATPLPDGTIKLPADIARRLAGVLAVGVEISVREADSRLAVRGVAAAEIAAVCAAQRLEPEVVEYVLGGEGNIPPASPLFSSLLRLLPPS